MGVAKQTKVVVVDPKMKKRIYARVYQEGGKYTYDLPGEFDADVLTANVKELDEDEIYAVYEFIGLKKVEHATPLLIDVV